MGRHVMFCLCIFLSIGFSLFGKPLPVETSAKSAVLMNAETGAILYEKNAHARMHPASTTKIATALYILDQNFPIQTLATVSGESLKMKPAQGPVEPYWLELDGTMMKLRRGEQVDIDTLLHGLMLMSGNDAANVLAETVCGSVPQFMEAINQYLQNLGCKNTTFCNPHGLTYEEHLTTAYDMAIMTKRALQIPHFRKIVSTLLYQKPKTNKQPAGEIKMCNALLRDKSPFYYQKAIGVKTGTTNAAGETLVAAAEHEGRTLIAVILGSDKKKTGQRYRDAKKLFEAAFREEKTKRRVLGMENAFVKQVPKAKKPVRAAVSRALFVEYFPAEEPECKAALHWNVALPVKKGQRVGEVHILDGGNRILGKGELIALEDVRGDFFLSMKEWVRGFWTHK